MKNLAQQMVKFATVGSSAFVVEYGLLILLNELALPILVPGIDPQRSVLIATPIAFTVSTVYSYVLSMKWVFEKRVDKSSRDIFLIFLLLSVIALGLNQLFMTLFVSHLEMNAYLSKLLTTMLVTIYNFISRKQFIEEHHKNLQTS